MKRITCITAIVLLAFTGISEAAYSSQYGNREPQSFSVVQNLVKQEGSYTNGLNGPFFVSYQGLKDVSNKMQEKLGIADFSHQSNSNTHSETSDSYVESEPYSAPAKVESTFLPTPQSSRGNSSNRSFAKVAEGVSNSSKSNTPFNSIAQTF